MTDFVDFSEKGRSHFLNQVTEMVDGIEEGELDIEVGQSESKAEPTIEPKFETELDLEEERRDRETSNPTQTSGGESKMEKARKMEEVMNNGIQFLAGLMEMSSGKKVDVNDQKIEVDPESGEVTMKFKMPL